MFLLDNDRQTWKRIYVEGPATGTIVKEIFGSTIDILGAECGGSELLADFIIKGHETDRIINKIDIFYFQMYEMLKVLSIFYFHVLKLD